MSTAIDGISNTQLKSPFGTFSLQRFPPGKKEILRAWDAADEFILEHLAEQKCLDQNRKKILLVNDQFGALAVNLNDHILHSWSDSWLTRLATENNLLNNQIEARISFIRSTEALQGVYDLILLKLPKTIALLEDQLIKIRQHINEETVIISSAMTRFIHTAGLKLFESIIGPTKTSLAVKKARLIFTDPDLNIPSISTPYPKIVNLKEFDIELLNHANVFARDQIDIGARFMIEQFGHLPEAGHIIDLGCGNGVLGIMAKRYRPEARIIFVDESYMAITSAIENYKKNCTVQNAEFIISDCLEQVSATDVDLILCNPPFHQQHAIGDQTAWRMFNQSKQKLRKGGQLWVIGNRHLKYHAKLKRIYGHCQLIASNRKFVVLSAIKQ